MKKVTMIHVGSDVILIKVNGINYNTVKVTPFGVTLDNGKFIPTCDLHGVELSNEILSKMGFEFDGFQYKYPNLHVYVYKRSCGTWYLNMKKLNDIRNIDYVHELQTYLYIHENINMDELKINLYNDM